MQVGDRAPKPARLVRPLERVAEHHLDVHTLKGLREAGIEPCVQDTAQRGGIGPGLDGIGGRVQRER